MKKNMMERVKKDQNSERRLNLMREECHHLILQEADRKGAFAQICFVGGTALRIIYGLDRFSEDLDFSTSAAISKPFDLPSLLESIQKSMVAFGFDCMI